MTTPFVSTQKKKKTSTAAKCVVTRSLHMEEFLNSDAAKEMSPTERITGLTNLRPYGEGFAAVRSIPNRAEGGYLERLLFDSGSTQLQIFLPGSATPIVLKNKERKYGDTVIEYPAATKLVRTQLTSVHPLCLDGPLTAKMPLTDFCKHQKEILNDIAAPIGKWRGPGWGYRHDFVTSVLQDAVEVAWKLFKRKEVARLRNELTKGDVEFYNDSVAAKQTQRLVETASAVQLLLSKVENYQKFVKSPTTKAMSLKKVFDEAKRAFMSLQTQHYENMETISKRKLKFKLPAE